MRQAELKVSNFPVKHGDSQASSPEGTGPSLGSQLAAGKNSPRMKAASPTHNSVALVGIISNYSSSASLLNVVMVTVEL